MNINEMKKKADELFPNEPSIYKIKKAYFSVLNFIHKADWSGACHASSSVLFVLLREQKINANIFIGEVARDKFIFDHSWVEIGSLPYDAAISHTLIEGFRFSPVFKGVDLETGKNTESNYGFVSGNGLEEEMNFYSKNTLGYYIDSFPDHPQGLWGIASILAKDIGIKFSVTKARQKYSDERWQLKS